MRAIDELEHLGRLICARIHKAEKATRDANDHYMAAGLTLKQAKALILESHQLTWPEFLKQNCRLGRSRADELIAVADGKTTVENLRNRKRRSSAATYNRYRNASRAASSGKQATDSATGTRLAIALRAFDALSHSERLEFCSARSLFPAGPKLIDKASMG
jgi:hypothetical protein